MNSSRPSATLTLGTRHPVMPNALLNTNLRQPSPFTLVLIITPNMRVADGGLVRLEYQAEDGTKTGMRMHFPPRHYRVLYELAMAAEQDANTAGLDPEDQGFRSTYALRELYAKRANEVVLPSEATIYHHITKLRAAISASVRKLSKEVGIEFDDAFSPIHNERGSGYRIGGIRSRMLDCGSQ
jgi:hypothetical protein